MTDMPDVAVEVAWDTPPLVRPDVDDWTRIDAGVLVDDVDVSAKMQALTTRRGARLKVAEIETGEATATFSNIARSLEPGFEASPWFPNVEPRRRIRFTVHPAGDDEPPRRLFTGFIDQLPQTWHHRAPSIDVGCVDLMALLAEDTLPPSVLHGVITASGPLGYWPLTDESGSFADDVAGANDAMYRREVSDGVEIMTHDPRPVARFTRNWTEDRTGQAAKIPTIRPGGSFTVAWSIRHLAGDPVSGTRTVFLWSGTDNPRAPDSGFVPWFEVGLNELGIFVTTGDGTAWSSSFTLGPQIADGATHRLVLTVDTATSQITAWVDGRRTDWFSASFPTTNLTSMAAGLVNAWVGYGLTSPHTTTAMEAAVGHLAIWSRVLDDDEIAEDWAAASTAWDGDLTSDRVHRILDLLGVDPGDRNIATGTAVCGPTVLAAGNPLEYLRQIAATEGGAIFVDPDGRVTFTAKPPNNPTAAATFTGDPAAHPGIPYADVSPEYSVDRVINVAEVTRESGTVQRTVRADSLERYGPAAVEFTTLHQTPSGARSAGAELTNRFTAPSTVLQQMVIAGRSDDVPTSIWDFDIGTTVEVVAQPGPGTSVTKLVRLDRIEHQLDWRSWDHRAVFGLTEVVVLPCFRWDTAGQGWDQAVWCPSEPFSDDFDRPDASTWGDPWVVHAGDFAIASGKGKTTTASGPVPTIVMSTIEFEDPYRTIEWTSEGNKGHQYFIARFVDINNMVGVFGPQSGDSPYLSRRVDGTWTVFASTSGKSWNNSTVITVIDTGHHLTVLFNGVEVLAAADSTHAGGRVGWGGNAQTSGVGSPFLKDGALTSFSCTPYT